MTPTVAAFSRQGRTENETIVFRRDMEWSAGRSGGKLSYSNFAHGERAMTLQLDLLSAECGNIFVAGEIALPKEPPAAECTPVGKPWQAESQPVIDAPAGVWGY